MSEKYSLNQKMRTLKTLLMLAPVFFVWIEIALPNIVAPLFGEKDQRPSFLASSVLGSI
jgi:hypothetical protein